MPGPSSTVVTKTSVGSTSVAPQAVQAAAADSFSAWHEGQFTRAQLSGIADGQRERLGADVVEVVDDDVVLLLRHAGSERRRRVGRPIGMAALGVGRVVLLAVDGEADRPRGPG